MGHSFHTGSPAALKTARRAESTITPLAAFKTVVRLLDLPIRDVASAVAERADGTGESYTIKQVEGFMANPTAKLVYVTKETSLVLAWRIETDIGSNWFISYVDAASGNEITGVTEYANTASYEA